jgi:hypothetical protein
MAQSDTDYLYLQGEVWIGDRSVTGTVASFVNIPEVDELTLAISQEKVTHVSKRASMRVKDLDVTVMSSLTGTLKFSSATADLLKQALFGAKATVAAGTITSQSLGSGLAVGDIVKVPGDYRDITLTFIKDSAGSPATLVNGTDYTIDLAAGMVKILSLGSYTQPFLITGSAGVGTGVGLLNERKFEKWLRFKGINVADGDNSVTMDLYKISFSPTKALQLLAAGNEPTARDRVRGVERHNEVGIGGLRPDRRYQDIDVNGNRKGRPESRPNLDRLTTTATTNREMFAGLLEQSRVQISGHGRSLLKYVNTNQTNESGPRAVPLFFYGLKVFVDSLGE